MRTEDDLAAEAERDRVAEKGRLRDRYRAVDVAVAAAAARGLDQRGQRRAADRAAAKFDRRHPPLAAGVVPDGKPRPL